MRLATAEAEGLRIEHSIVIPQIMPAPAYWHPDILKGKKRKIEIIQFAKHQTEVNQSDLPSSTNAVTTNIQILCAAAKAVLCAGCF